MGRKMPHLSDVAWDAWDSASDGAPQVIISRVLGEKKIERLLWTPKFIFQTFFFIFPGSRVCRVLRALKRWEKDRLIEENFELKNHKKEKKNFEIFNRKEKKKKKTLNR